LVQLSLPAGWSWASGSGSFLTDSNGDVTVPAGQIIAGPKLGTIAATYGSGSTTVTTATDLAVVSRGSMQYFGFMPPDLSVPSAINSDFVRVYANWNSVLALKANGELWVCYDSGAWTQVASGADLGANQAAFIVDSDVQKAIWTSGGELYLGGVKVALPGGSNAGFVRVAGGAGTAVAAKSDGEIWKWSKVDGWSLLGSNGLSGPEQMACLTAASESVVWIKGGSVYIDSIPADIPSADNSEFRQIAAGRGRTASDSGVVAVKANGDVWRFNGSTWAKIGSNAEVGPGKLAYIRNSPYVVAWWISGGVVMRENGSQFPSAAENHDIIRIIQNGPVAMVLRRDGVGFRWYDGGQAFATNVSSGLNQGARALNSTSSAGLSPAYFIQNAESC
jgi:hypothetical protein